MVIASFCAFLLVFVLIGLSSLRQSKHDSLDYLLAGHSVPAWLVGLSAVATNNSGYMFTGVIGYTYVEGLSAIWLMLGWISGDFAASLFVHKRLRIATELREVHSFSGALARWNDTFFPRLRAICGTIALLFLGTYAAAQLSAGSKALSVLFHWPFWSGAVVGAVIVLLYCFAGGIRASIWTDAAQSVVMITAMAVLLWSAAAKLGGIDAAWRALDEVDPAYLDWFPGSLPFGPLIGGFLFVAGWFAAGFGVVGQPHIMIRFMTLDKPEKITAARTYYYIWYFLFYAAATGVGLLSRVLIPDSAAFDPELALPMLSLDLLPPYAVGLILAGLFAATMSTADSLILSCSASLTRDFTLNRTENYLVTKAGTVLITLAALGIALFGSKSVFELVVVAWAVLASAFAPLLMVYTLRQRPTEGLASAMVLSGTITVFIWRQLGWHEAVYEILPGMIAGFAVFLLGKALGWELPETAGSREVETMSSRSLSI